MRRLKHSVTALVIALLATTSVATAEPASISTEPVIDFATEDVVGVSQLVRTDNGITMNLRTTGLEPGDVVTIWWVVFNNPDECATTPCGGPDLFDAAVGGSVFYAAGTVVGQSGRGNFAAHLTEGRLSIDDSLEANQLIMGEGGGLLTDARGAEVHLVVRTHGPKIPHMVNQMLKTHDAGCSEATASPIAPPEMLADNECENLQASAHLPPE